MSWFQRGNIRNSLRRSASPSPPKELDANACYESFKTHWQQAWEIISKPPGTQPRSSRADSIRAVMNHIDQMVTLLLHDLRIPNNTMGPILDYLLTEDVLDKLFEWSTKAGENINALKLEQLKLYELLISHSQQELLVHKPILQPMLKLLSICSDCAPVEVEKRLVILLNQLCVSLTQNAALLDFFFCVSNQQEPTRFLIFSLLIPFVHREGGIGQQARDALLLCMSLSTQNSSMGVYIAEHSNFCPILATGLSGLYSLLPRKLSVETEDWHRLTADDVHDIPELAMFLNSFGFCNAVIQVSYPVVQEQLLEYLYQGFLVPVLGPALHQTSVDEIIAATTYLELFLRTITEPALLQVFLKFIFTEVHDGTPIIETLIARIATQSRLCLVTLALFWTLVDFNCEDVMYHLIFRYLIPCTHVMVSQRCRVRDFDIYSKTAEKFLSLVPACCQHEVDQEDSQDVKHEDRQNQPTSFPGVHRRTVTVTEGEGWRITSDRTDVVYETRYSDYLYAARKEVNSCLQSCEQWVYSYNGEKPSPEEFRQAATYSSSSRGHENAVTVYTNDGNVHNAIDSFQSEDTSKSDNSNKNANYGSKSEMGTAMHVTCASEFSDSKNVSETTFHEMLFDPSTTNFEVKMSSFGKLYDTSFHRSVAKPETDDQAFWDTLRQCKTPPPGNIEDSLKEIDLALGLVSSIRRRSHPQLTANCAIKELEYESLHNKRKTSSEALLEDIVVLGKNSTKNKDDIDTLVADTVLAQSLSQGYNESFGNPDIGPFLSMLFTKLENMMQNNLYINLQLTGLIARLAYYPQPLLRSFLLNHTLVFQPTVRSLLQVLGSLKHKLDSYSSSVDNFNDLLLRARKFLKARDDRLVLDGVIGRTGSERSRRNSSPEGIKVESKRRSITDFIFRRQTVSSARSAQRDALEGIPDGTGYRYINRPFPDAPDGKLESLKTKNAVLCAVVLEEFLKELAAITQEHSVAEIDDIDFDNFVVISNGL